MPSRQPMWMHRFLAFEVFFSLQLIVATTLAAEPNGPPMGKRVMFLGDSITDAGEFIVQLEAQLYGMANRPELINLGLPSETCSGLSEPAHPFPRPDVHERLQRALDLVKPDVVIACYGMNDAIYHPFDETRFEKYQAGMTRLISASKAADAKVVLLTPPPFDPLPLRQKGKLRPATAREFDWRTPYENYDEVIERYGDWLLSQHEQVDDVIDLLRPIANYVEDKRAKDPKFALSHDGVHINEEGHRVLAETILHRWNLEVKPVDAGLVSRVRQRQKIMHAAWLTEVGHTRPGVKAGLPLDEARAKAAKLTEQSPN